MKSRPFGLAVKSVLVDEAGRHLLIRRSAGNNWFAGQWEWPGGKVDPGEDFASAVIREAREETGLDIEITGLAGATAFDMPKVRVVVLCMEARIIGGEIRLSDEHDAFDWVLPSDFVTRELPEGVANFMREYASRNDAGKP